MTPDDLIRMATVGAQRERVEWLEDVLAGLMTAGVQSDEIEVQEQPLVTVVAVYGEPKYRFQINITAGGR